MRSIPAGFALGVIAAAISAPMQMWGVTAVGVVVALFSLYRNQPRPPKDPEEEAS